MWAKALSLVGAALVLAVVSGVRPGFAPSGEGYAVALAGYAAAIDETGALRVSAGGEAIVLRTREVSRGAERWQPEGRPELIDGIVRAAIGPAVETLAATEEGVAQRWEIAAPPPGEGPLVVRIATEGGQAPKGDRRGVKLGGLRYGEATWIDGRGRHTPLSMSTQGREIAIEVPASVVENSVYPVVLDPIVGPDEGVDEPAWQAAEGQQFSPSIAFDGARYLAAWRDVDGIRALFLDPTQDDFGIADTGFVIADGQDPHVAFDGSQYLVVFRSTGGISGVRLTPDGAVLDDPPQFLVPVGDFGAGALSLAGGGGRFLVLHSPIYQFGNPPALATLLDANLTVLGGPTTLAEPAWAVAAHAAGRFVVTWLKDPFLLPDTVDVDGAFVDASTMAVTPFAAPLTTTASNASPPGMVALPDGTVVVAYADTRNATVDLYARAIAPNDAIGAEQLLVGDPGDQTAPRLALTENGGAGFWSSTAGCGLCGRTMGSDGSATGPVFALGNGQRLAAAGGTFGALAIWDDAADILGRGLSGGALGLPFPVAVRANSQHTPAAVASGGNYVVAWLDERPGDAGLWANRIGSDGLPATVSAPAGNDPSLTITTMASDGTTVLALASDGVGAAELAGGTPFPLTPTPIQPSSWPNVGGAMKIAHDGDTFLVLSSQSIGICGAFCEVFDLVDIHRIASDGTYLEAVEGLDHESRARNPAAAGLGDAALVVWESTGSDPGISAALVPHGATPTMPFVVGDAPEPQITPAVASNGEIALVVWEDGRHGGREIWGARVSLDGMVLDPDGFAISDTVASGLPAVAWMDDGHSFLVVWEGSAADAPSEIFGAWVTRDGVVLDVPPIALTTSETAVERPVLASQGAGIALLAFERIVPELRASRVRTALIHSGVLDGGDCQSGDECASRVCGEGVCCREACGVCQTCAAGADGACTLVQNADDDTCFGTVTCDAEGQCKPANGQPCQDGEECASGFCVEGLCCDGACDGGCETCLAVPGSCTLRDCGAYGCNEDKSCRDSCDDSSECAPGFQCTAERTCAPAREPVPFDVGCGCRLVKSPEASPWAALFLFLALGRRRRTS